MTSITYLGDDAAAKAAPKRFKGDSAMRVFVTGATGFIGSALVPELIKAGHQVLGLARSDEGADVPASSALTRERLGWRPTGVGLMEDLAHARDFEV
jgi:nucleoside-diphosphate-sugar epimerase